MKTFKQIITVVALAMFMLGSFSGNAQKNNPNINNSGEVHNYILENLIKNNISLVNNDDLSGVFDEITVLIEKIGSKEINSKNLFVARESVSAMLKEINLFTTKLKLSDTKKMLDYTYSKKLIGKELKSKFDALFINFNKKDIKGYEQAVSDLKSFKPKNKKDREILKATLSVYNHSISFWSSYSSSKGFWTSMLTPLADLAGAAVGTAVAGPFGGWYVGSNASIAVGALVYHIENE